MRIGSASGINAQPAASKPGQTEDAYSKSLKNQIDNAKKRLQELSSDTEMQPEAKMKRRQEIMKEISDLQNQLRQHEIELRKQEQQKKENEKSDSADNGKTQRQGEESAAGFSSGSMQALISADSSMKQAEVHGSVKTEMKDTARVLEKEIELDSKRGQDTSRKEAELADVEGKAADAARAQMNTLAEADQKLQAASKEQRSEDTAENKAEYKEEQNPSDVNKAGDTKGLDISQQASGAEQGSGSIQGMTEADRKEETEKGDGEEEAEKIKYMLHHTGLPDDYKPVNILL